MRLLLDQGLPRSAVLHLKNAGIEAARVGDRGLATPSDSKILDFGRQEGRVVVLGGRFPRVVGTVRSYRAIRNSRIRIEGLRAEGLTTLLVDVLKVCKDDLMKGAVVCVTGRGVRIRKLPLLR